MASNFAVVYDACVLYPAPLRDLLMRLALTDLYRAKWTDQIHEEWTRNLLAKRSDLSAGRLAATRELMNGHVRDLREVLRADLLVCQNAVRRLCMGADDEAWRHALEAPAGGDAFDLTQCILPVAASTDHGGVRVAVHTVKCRVVRPITASRTGLLAGNW